MNTVVILTMIYGLMTLGSASILYISFKGRPDPSAKYFLFAELQTFLALPLVALANISPVFETSFPVGLTNSLVLASDVAIFFSLYSLTKTIQLSRYCLALSIIGVYCAFSEYCRLAIDQKLPYILFNIPSAMLAFGTFYICKNSINANLAANSFMKWIGRLEFLLGIFACIRLLSYFSDAPITPRHSTTGMIIFYVFYIVLSLFRYISYQSLRISWIDTRANDVNFLNQNLANVSQEKNQLMQTLLASNRALGVSALANSLAHQLSQPLTSIALQTEAIKCDLVESNVHQPSVRSLNKISMQLEKLADLVKNLRQLFSSGNHQFSAINLRDITEEILEVVQPTLQTKSINLEKIYLSDPVVLGNAIQLQQVLINLFNNAIDAIDQSDLPNGKIILSISQSEDFSLIRIQDNGPGISASFLPGMFNLYKTSKQEGLGIGLWLSKTIVDKHNGTICASNNSHGGATLEISLPLAKKEGGQQ